MPIRLQYCNGIVAGASIYISADLSECSSTTCHKSQRTRPRNALCAREDWATDFWLKQENWSIAKMTARCAQYMSALKIVCKRKISRRLRRNLHIINNLILSLRATSFLCHFQPIVLHPVWSVVGIILSSLSVRLSMTSGIVAKRYVLQQEPRVSEQVNMRCPLGT